MIMIEKKQRKKEGTMGGGRRKGRREDRNMAEWKEGKKEQAEVIHVT